MVEHETVCKSQMSCCKKHSLNRDPADNGSTVSNLMDEEFLRNCEHFLPDPIEIPSNEKIESYPFWERTDLNFEQLKP